MQSGESKERGVQRRPDPGGANPQGAISEVGRRPADTGMAPGHPIDEVGGAGLGQAPGEGNKTAGGPSAPNPPEKRAADPQDKRNEGNDGGA